MRGLAVTSLAQVWLVCLNLLSGIVMARLLVPQDFGLVAMVAPSIALVSLVQDMGVHLTVIQRSEISQRQISAMFATSALVSVALALVLVASAPLQAEFYSEPRVSSLLVAFSGLVVLWNLQSIPMALLVRQMNFTAAARIEVAANTLGFVAGAGFAAATGSYWALFVAMATTALINSSGAWIASGFTPHRPSFEGEMRSLLGLGSSLTLGSIFNYVERNADIALIGRFRDAVELGYYSRAYTLLLMPLRQIRNPIGRVILPYLSKARNDPARYAYGYTTALSVMLLLVHPALLVLSVFAEDVFTLLLGPQWRPAGEVFFWLGIAGMHQILTSTVGWVLTSQGRGRDIVLTSGLGCLISVTAFVIGLPDGAVGIARAYAISDIVVKMPVIWWIATRRGPLSLADFAASMLPHLAALLVVGGVFFNLRPALPAPGVGGIGVLTLASYLGCLAVLGLFPAKRAVLAGEFRKRALPMIRRVLA